MQQSMKQDLTAKKYMFIHLNPAILNLMPHMRNMSNITSTWKLIHNTKDAALMINFFLQKPYYLRLS